MATDGTLDERYLTWLHRQFEPTTNRNPARSHWTLFKQMYETEFTWFIPNDDNRVYDGLALRQIFIDEQEGGDVPGYWLSLPCSFLEMLAALCISHLAFQSDPLTPQYWFWRLMENLNLRVFTDEAYNDGLNVHEAVKDILSTVIDRTYFADGRDGLFPLIHPGHDQRELEIWYQMSHYLMENINV